MNRAQADPRDPDTLVDGAPPKQAAARVVLENVSHRFGSRDVFNNITGCIHSGQVGTVTGANGSGKSTLLKIIAGLLTPASGSAHVEIGGAALNSLARRPHIGLVAPDLSLYRELSAAENLTFFAELRGMSPTKEELIARLTEVGLRGRGRDLVGSYSSGMRQRLKYAFALLGSPAILLLDEPTANLDSEGAGMVKGLIERQTAGGGLVIVATNDAAEALWGDSLATLGAAS